MFHDMFVHDMLISPDLDGHRAPKNRAFTIKTLVFLAYMSMDLSSSTCPKYCGGGKVFLPTLGEMKTAVLCLILMMAPCPFGNGTPPSAQFLKAQAIAARDGGGWLEMADQAHSGLLQLRDDVSSQRGAPCCFHFLTRKCSLLLLLMMMMVMLLMMRMLLLVLLLVLL
jgi:hypothetical protein